LTVRTLWESGPVLYLIWRSRERWSVFGVRRPRWLGDLLLGGVIWATAHGLCYAVVYQYGYLLSVLNGMVPMPEVAFTQAPRGAAEYALLVLACCANGFNEELLMRGYLLPRFEQLLGSTWKGLLLTTVLFALLHVYQGTYGVVAAAVLGLVYGVAFCWLRRLWPVAIAHALADFVAYAGS
jgi:uncharacterized protein